MMNIMPHTKIKEELKRERKFLRNIIATIPDSLLVLDKDLRIKSANRSFYKLFQTGPKKVIGSKITDILGDENGKLSAGLTKLFGTKGILKNFELHYHSEKLGERIFNIIARGTIVAEEEEEEEEEEEQLVVIQDITERKRAEEALKESEQKYRFLVENLDEIVLVLSRKGKILFANKKAVDTSGYPKEQFVGQSILKFLTKDSVAKAFYALVQEFLGRPQPMLQVKIKTRSGEIRDLEIAPGAAPVYEKGKQIGILINGSDITERKRAEERLWESEKKYKTLFETKLDGVFVIDAETMRVVLANQAAVEMYGFSSVEEAIGMNPLDFVVPEERERTLRIIAEDMFEKNLHQVNEFRTITKDGKEKWISAVGARIEYQGKSAGLVSFRDITERKRAEEEIKYQKKYFQSLFENAPEAVASLDAQNLFVDINPAFEKIFGYTSGDIKGKDINDCIVPGSKKEEGRSFRRRVSHGEVVVAESIRKRADGREIPVSILSAPIMIDGKLIGTFAIYRDITERKKAQEQLENSFVDLAETVSRAMESRDPYTSGHQRRVAELARLVGEKMGLDKDRLQGLHIGGLLHDIGKVSTPESILAKPGRLSDEEWSLIHAHAKQGYLILKGTNLPWPVADMALHHHERLDGSGYPHGISGDKLSLEVRILGVCDVVEAMSSRRPYRSARSKEEVLEEIKSGRGTKYAPDVVDVMLEIIENGEFEVQGSGNRRL